MNEYMWEDELECARVKVHRADIWVRYGWVRMNPELQC